MRLGWCGAFVTLVVLAGGAGIDGPYTAALALQPPAKARPAEAPAPGFDLGAAIDAVRCRIRPVEGAPGRLSAAGERYGLTLSPDGVRLEWRSAREESLTGDGAFTRRQSPVGLRSEPPHGRADTADPSLEDAAALRRPPSPGSDGGHDADGAPQARGARSPARKDDRANGPAPSLTLSVSRVSASGARVPLRTGAWREASNAANTAERPVAKGIIERVTASNGSVEWEFVLTRPPSGDLAIEALASGGGPAERVSVRAASRRVPAMQVQSPSSAWRWPLGQGRHLLLGEMTVRDAAGAILHRALPRALGGAISLEVPLRSLQGAAYPVRIDPTLSPELPLSDPVFGPAANDQFTPRAAWNGQIYLVVWTDNRSGYADVYGTRISAAGEVLDRTGIPIAASPDPEAYPAVASDGTGFLVVWQHQPTSGVTAIRAARVDGSGALADSSPILVSSGAGAKRFPSVAWAGTSWLVAWEDQRCGTGTCSEIYGTRLTGSGLVLDPSNLGIATGPGVRRAPTVSCGQPGCLVAWEEGGFGTKDIRGSRVASDGTVIDTAGILLGGGSGDQKFPAAGWNGEDWLVVWEDDGCGSRTCADLGAVRLSAAGELLDDPPIVVSSAPGPQVLPALTLSEGDWCVAWADGRSGEFDVYDTRVTADGTVLDPDGIPISTAVNAQFAPTIASSGSGLLIAWEDDRCGGIGCADIFAAHLTPAGVLADIESLPISGSAVAQALPAVAFNGTNFLVVWEEDRTGDLDIYGARIATDGTLLDGGGIMISTAPGNQIHPEVVWDGSGWLVVWEDDRCGDLTCADLYGARISAGGEVLDPAEIPISTAPGPQFEPAVAPGAESSLVVWLDARSGLAAYGARLDHSGTVLDPEGILIAPFSDGQGGPAVAGNGTDWLVASIDYRAATSYDVFGCRISGAGEVIDTAPIVLSDAPGGQSGPALAWDGTNWMAVWEDFRSGSSYDLYGARVNPRGKVLDRSGTPVCDEAGAQFFPALTWTGTSRVLLWSDSRAGESVSIYASRLDGAAHLLPAGSSGLIVATQNDAYGVPRLAGTAAGRIAIVYDSFDDDPLVRSRRAWVRLLDECLVGGGLGGSSCAFALVSPPVGSVLPGTAAAPTFWWGPGSFDRFRVEFSASEDFGTRRVLSRPNLIPGTAWTPNAAKWKRIRALAPAGEPIYWRVIGRSKGSSARTTSPQTFSLTLTP